MKDKDQLAGYAAQQHDIQLMNVDNAEGLVKEIQRVVKNDPHDVLNMRVMMTIVDGRILFNRK